MPKERKKVLCMDAQRHAEYYGMQRTFDKLYAKSKAGETFTGLMELVLSPDNIMLAYRNIKANTGSYTAGTDKQNMSTFPVTSPAITNWWQSSERTRSIPASICGRRSPIPLAW